MDAVKPADLATAMVDAAEKKLTLSPQQLLIRGAMSGALLGTATSFAFTGVISSGGQSLIGALIFPTGLVITVLLGLELITGSFGLVPLSLMERKTSASSIATNWMWVFVGNLIGSIGYGILFAIALTNFGNTDSGALGAMVVATAEQKTIAYSAMGASGWIAAFVKAILCNWLVCLGIVMAMTSTSTIGKIVAVWMPISIFFAQGFEHSVVNMFVIPAGMMLGANVSVSDWWLWNQIPVTLGNLVGGFVFTGLAISVAYRPDGGLKARVPRGRTVAAK